MPDSEPTRKHRKSKSGTKHHRTGDEKRRRHKRRHSTVHSSSYNDEVSIDIGPEPQSDLQTPVVNLNLSQIESDPTRGDSHRTTPELNAAQFGAISDLAVQIHRNPSTALITPRKLEGSESSPWVDQLRDEISELRAAGLYGKDVDITAEESSQLQKIAKRLYKHREGRLWRHNLKKIEGKFGSGVGAFFRLVRWVFLLNFFTAIIWIAFILSPGYSVEKGPVDMDVDIPTVSGVPDLSLKPSNYEFTTLFTGRDLTGTYLIQSAYPSAAVFNKKTAIFAIPFSSKIDGNRVYDFRIAYGATITLVMAGVSLFIIRWLRQRTLSGSMEVLVKEDKDFPYSVVVFGTWDHNVSNASAARTMRHGITRRLRELAESRRVMEKHKILSGKEKFFLIFRRIFGWLLIFGLAGLFFILILYFSNNNSSEIVVPVIVATINVMIPFLVRQIVRLMGYGLEEIILKRQIMITYVLKMWNLTVLVIRMFSNHLIESLPFVTSPDEESSINTLATNTTEPECNIHQVGRDFWTLLFIDLLVSCGYTLIVPRVLTMITKKPRTFTVSSNVIEVIYRQALIWIGTLVSPGAVIVGAAANFILFYIKRHQLMRWCEPEYKAWGAAQGEKFFVVLLSVTLTLCWIPTIWILTRIPTCGPLADGTTSYMTKFVESLDFIGIPSTQMTLKELLFTIAKASYMVPICCVLLIRLYFLSASRKKLKTRILQVELDRDHAKKEIVKIIQRMRATGNDANKSNQARRNSMFVNSSSILSSSSTPQSDTVSKIVQDQLRKK